MTDPTPWGRRDLPPGGVTESLTAGPLKLWLRGVKNELWIAHLRGEVGGAHLSEPPEDADWHRWALRDAAHHLVVLPVFPNRPLVVQPEDPFTLLRKAEARIYIGVPAGVSVQVVETNTGVSSTLLEIPTETLSDTWWGGFVEGSLAYWLPTSARRDVPTGLFGPHVIICALQLINQSGGKLPVEKLQLRVDHLSVFEKSGELWGEEVVVEYQGEEIGSDIRMNDVPPPEAQGAHQITPPRAASKSFRSRTFARLKALSGLGA